MNKKQELEYIAKYNIKNGTHFYNVVAGGAYATKD